MTCVPTLTLESTWDFLFFFSITNNDSGWCCFFSHVQPLLGFAEWIYIIINEKSHLTVISVWWCVCPACVLFFQIITQYVYKLLEDQCKLKKEVIPVSTQSGKKSLFSLWYWRLKGLLNMTMDVNDLALWHYYGIEGSVKTDCLRWILRTQFSVSLCLSFAVPHFFLTPCFFPFLCTHPLCKSVSSTN